MSESSILSAWPKVSEARQQQLAGVALISASLLSLTQAQATTLGLHSTIEAYRGTIGLALVGSMGFFTVNGAVACYSYFSVKRAEKKAAKKAELAEEQAKLDILKGLHSLSYDELMIIVSCVNHNRRTIYLEMADPTAQSLCYKGLLEQAGGMGDPLSWSFILPEFVWEHLQKNKDALFPNGFLTMEQTVKSQIQFELLKGSSRRMYR